MTLTDSIITGLTITIVSGIYKYIVDKMLFDHVKSMENKLKELMRRKRK